MSCHANVTNTARIYFLNKNMLKSGVFKYWKRELNLFIRRKHKNTRTTPSSKKKAPTFKALEHFDDFYEQVFTNSWPAIRQGLLSKQKYVAVVNNYSDTQDIKTGLENLGALNVRTLFNLEKQYITDNYDKVKRKLQLEHIWKMDKQMDIEQEKTATETNEVRKMSLEKSLENAEYDFTRVVDSENVLTTANLHEFIPVTKIKGSDEWIPESDHYKFYSSVEFPVKIEKEYDLHFPEHLDVYCYEMSNHTTFAYPRKGTTDVYNYYLMDGGSLLPILALDIKPGNKILDMCAAPGGKSLLALQTLYPDQVMTNDVSMSRRNRIYQVLKEYFYDLEERWLKTGKIVISNRDGREIEESNFDRILVDVPCTTDRHSVKEDENNIFRPDRIRERLKLPELQSQLLVQALKLIAEGGVVVYSTCSLSPIQNDGVVHMALKQIWEETKIQILVKNLGPALTQTRSVFKLADPKLMKYGHLVVPNLQANFGPTYFCKLQRIK